MRPSARPASSCSASSRAAPTSRLRERSAGELVPLGFDGYAIGGLSVGEERGGHVRHGHRHHGACCRTSGPRYFMGIGDPDGVLDVIERGVDMFDCVLPTRLGRTGSALVPGGRINLRNARFARDPLAAGGGLRLPGLRRASRAPTSATWSPRTRSSACGC